MALVKYNNNSISAITSTGLTSGAMTLIKEQTASASATIDFVDGTSDVVLDNTYPIYLFKFINVHASANADFTVNFRDGGSSYDATKTTTIFHAQHNEAGDYTDLSYQASDDVAQGTGATGIARNLGTGNDESCSGEMWLFNPSSTTYVKHFMARAFAYQYISAQYQADYFAAGYCNVTAAIDGVQFAMASGNIDAGTFKLYGIKDS